MSEGTIRKDIAVLSAVLSYGVSEGFLAINPLIYSDKRRGHKKATKEYKVELHRGASEMVPVGAGQSYRYTARGAHADAKKWQDIYRERICTAVAAPP